MAPLFGELLFLQIIEYLFVYEEEFCILCRIRIYVLIMMQEVFL